MMPRDPILERGGARFGDRVVLVAGAAAHADGPDHLPVVCDLLRADGRA
jgi:hypothetical protein